MTTLLIIALLASLCSAVAAKEEPALAGPLITDAEFFSLLDYSLPYLSKVEKAHRNGDYAAAKAEFLAAMRIRRKPVFRVNWWERKWVVKEPLPNVWVSKPGFDYASGVYNEGYGLDMDKSVAHRRQVLFVKPDYWVVLDTSKAPVNIGSRRCGISGRGR